MMKRSVPRLFLVVRSCVLAAMVSACVSGPTESSIVQRGDVCIAPMDWGCTTDDQCCGDAVCSPDGVCHLADGAACASAGVEGCLPGHYCVDGVCSAACGEGGQTVSDSADCCSGWCDGNGVCSDDCVAAMDGGCTTDDDCCGDGVCSPTGVCHLADGAACTSAGAEGCLPGHYCVDGACSATCGAAGQAAEDPADCCSGILLADGTCGRAVLCTSGTCPGPIISTR